MATAFYGVLFSLLEHDLKRALAFSTVENLGIMVAMVGAALLFRALDVHPHRGWRRPHPQRYGDPSVAETSSPPN